MLRRAQAARLLAVDRETPGTLLLLLGRDEAAIGSAEGSGLRVADASVADRHAIIRYARGRYYVVDLKSAGGTFVNGRRIRRKQELKHGDNIRFGVAAPYRFIDPDALKRRRKGGSCAPVRLSQHLSSSDWQITSGNGACFPARRSPRLSHGRIHAPRQSVSMRRRPELRARQLPRLHRHAQRIRRLRFMPSQ